jgi:hypothetical protein
LGAGLGTPLIAPGIDGAAVFIKFRVAVFFNTPLNIGLSLTPLTWIKWLTSLPLVNSNPSLGQTYDTEFDYLFYSEARNPALIPSLLNSDIRSKILALSKVSLYGEPSEIEMTDNYISYIEGPYTSQQFPQVGLFPTTAHQTPIGQQAQTNYFDQSEEILKQLTDLAKLVEQRAHELTTIA